MAEDRKVRRKPKKQEELRRWDSTEKDVYNTPAHILEEKFRRNAFGMIVRKKKNTDIDDKVDENNYTLARIEGQEETVPPPEVHQPLKRQTRRSRHF